MPRCLTMSRTMAMPPRLQGSGFRVEGLGSRVDGSAFVYLEALHKDSGF